jgi:hypothetical protein
MRVGNGATALEVAAEEQEPGDAGHAGAAAARDAAGLVVDGRRNPASEAGWKSDPGIEVGVRTEAEADTEVEAAGIGTVVAAEAGDGTEAGTGLDLENGTEPGVVEAEPAATYRRPTPNQSVGWDGAGEGHARLHQRELRGTGQASFSAGCKGSDMGESWSCRAQRRRIGAEEGRRGAGRC